MERSSILFVGPIEAQIFSYRDENSRPSSRVYVGSSAFNAFINFRVLDPAKFQQTAPKLISVYSTREKIIPRVFEENLKKIHGTVEVVKIKAASSEEDFSSEENVKHFIFDEEGSLRFKIDTTQTRDFFAEALSDEDRRAEIVVVDDSISASEAKKFESKVMFVLSKDGKKLSEFLREMKETEKTLVVVAPIDAYREAAEELSLEKVEDFSREFKNVLFGADLAEEGFALFGKGLDRSIIFSVSDLKDQMKESRAAKMFLSDFYGAALISAIDRDFFSLSKEEKMKRLRKVKEAIDTFLGLYLYVDDPNMVAVRVSKPTQLGKILKKTLDTTREKRRNFRR